MEKLILLDYNGTIVPNEPDVRPYKTIINSMFGEELAKEFKSPNRSKKLLIAKNFSKRDFEKFLNKFKSSEIYGVLKDSGNQMILDVLKKCDELPDTNIAGFVFEDIVCPLMALYNVYIAKIMPFPDFSDFFQDKSKEGYCIVINSNGPHNVLLMELREYAKMEEYSFINQLLGNELVFGNMEESKKTDGNRMQYILDKLIENGVIVPNLKDIVIIGDTKKDVENFMSISDQKIHSEIFLIEQNNLYLIEKLTERCKKLEHDSEKLEIASKQLDEVTNERKKLNEMASDRITLTKDFRSIVLGGGRSM